MKSNGVIVERNQPCVYCPSSDAMQVYEDGGAKCFSCGKSVTAKALRAIRSGEEPFEQQEYVPKRTTYASHKGPSIAEIQTLPIMGLIERDVTTEVAQLYKLRVQFGEDGKIAHHYYPYNGETIYKHRVCSTKTFFSIGTGKKKLFGIEAFNAGGKRVIVCEGETDTLCVQQASFDKYQKFYPVVGIPSSTTLDCLITCRDWLRSFDEIVLCFDNDEAGEEAANKAVKILGYDKCKVVKLHRKDIGDVHTEDGPTAVMDAIFKAEKRVPTGILTKEQLRAQMKAANKIKSIPYPECLAGLNSKLGGRRGGEIVMFVSGTGSGKSTIIREVLLDIAVNSEEQVGGVFLEESPGETAKKLAGLYVNKNVADEPLTDEEEDIGFDAVFGHDRTHVIDHQGAITDSSIFDKLEYLALLGCTALMVDHLTILVSEGMDGLTGNEAEDKMMNELLKIVKRHPAVTLFVVAHLRKSPNDKKSFEEGRMPSLDDIKGSGALKQVPFDIVASCRNLTAETEDERNTMRMAVLKGRTKGKTGEVEGLRYLPSTGRLQRLTAAEGFSAQQQVVQTKPTTKKAAMLTPPPPLSAPPQDAYQ